MPNANLVAAQNQLRNLVSIYNSNFDQYQQATYNETQVRVDFVNPFFQLLGWDVLNEAGLPQHLREVTHEATVLVEENGAHRSKKPDYSFKVGTEILFFLETKKPSVNITVDRAPSYDAMDGAETLKYLSLLISQIYLYMIVQYAQLKAMKLAPHLLHTIITQSMKISLRKFTRCSRKSRS